MPALEERTTGKNGKSIFQNKKKRTILLVGIIMVMISLVALMSRPFSNDTPKNEDTTNYKQKFIFYEPDYSINILEDPSYLELNRYIQYTVGAETFVITDGNYERYGDALAFVASFIDAIISGDAERYNSCFTDEYRREHADKECFTMQRLHEIKVELLENPTDDTFGEPKTYILISYIIDKNNGTFRTDTDDAGAKDEYYELVKRSGGYQINRIFSAVK